MEAPWRSFVPSMLPAWDTRLSSVGKWLNEVQNPTIAGAGVAYDLIHRMDWKRAMMYARKRRGVVSIKRRIRIQVYYCGGMLITTRIKRLLSGVI